MKHVIAQSQRRKTVFGIIFVVEIEQKQAIWCLKRKSLNWLVFWTVVKEKLQAYVIMVIFGEKRHSSYDVDLLY